MALAGKHDVFGTPNGLSSETVGNATVPLDIQRSKLSAKSFSPSTSTTAQDLTSRILDFLSNASNETLIASLVGLGATTYFVLGRLGLLLIGGVGGVVLH